MLLTLLPAFIVWKDHCSTYKPYLPSGLLYQHRVTPCGSTVTTVRFHSLVYLV